MKENFISVEELSLTCDIDFVIPLKQVGLITRAVLEAIHIFYKPRKIFVVTPYEETKILKHLIKIWNVGEVKCIAEEDFFENNYNLNLRKIRQYYDFHRSGNQREPGWWYQQLIKLGASTQIKDLSFVYVVWDGDLVPTRRWKLCELKKECDLESTTFINSDDQSKISNSIPILSSTFSDLKIDQISTTKHRSNSDLSISTVNSTSMLPYNNRKWYFAILQSEARSQFNTTQYMECMKSLSG